MLKNSPRKLFDLYISYNPKQKEQVKQICSIFKNYNLKIWYDQDQSQPHVNEEKFDKNLNALQSSYIFVCFLSRDYQKCIKNRIEFSIAHEQNMKIMNFYFEDYMRALKPLTNKVNSIDFILSSMNTNSLNLLAKAIKNEIEKNSKGIQIKQKENEIEEVFRNFRKSYEKTLFNCEYPESFNRIN